jgi:hypothetical protein
MPFMLSFDAPLPLDRSFAEATGAKSNSPSVASEA